MEFTCVVNKNKSTKKEKKKETMDATSLAQLYMETISSDAKRAEIITAREEVRKCQTSLLLEMGEVQLRLAKGEPVEESRRALLNSGLTLIECYLLSLECALLKVEFMRQVLNPSEDDRTIQSQVEYQRLLEELLFVQGKRAERILNSEPSLSTLVTPVVFQGVLAPFKQMCIANSG
jgi:hypothetical protein